MSRLVVLVLSAGTQVGQNVLATLARRRDGLTLVATSSVDNEPALFDYDAVYVTPPTATEPAAFEAALLGSLQSAWLELNVHERQPPHLVLARPFPPGDAHWQARPVLGVSAVRVTPHDQRVAATSDARGRSGMA